MVSTKFMIVTGLYIATLLTIDNRPICLAKFHWDHTFMLRSIQSWMCDSPTLSDYISDLLNTKVLCYSMLL